VRVVDAAAFQGGGDAGSHRFDGVRAGDLNAAAVAGQIGHDQPEPGGQRLGQPAEHVPGGHQPVNQDHRWPIAELGDG
jgi:hypothetical protein